MSAKPETTFIASIHKHLPRQGLYHMKNHNVYNAGVADVWYSGPWGDLWVEYKFAEVPKRDSTPVVLGLSELQKRWLRDRYKEGRSVGVMLGCREGGVWFPGLNWETPFTAADLRSWLTPRHKLAELIQYHTGPEP